MKSKVFFPAVFLVMILCSGSLIVCKPVKATDQRRILSIDQVPAKVVPNISSLCAWDENTHTLVFNDNKMGIVLSDKLPSGLPLVLQIYTMISTQIQCWIWEVKPRGIAKLN